MRDEPEIRGNHARVRSRSACRGRPYSGWYDDYYGVFHDGHLWFRLDQDDNHYRWDERRHFCHNNGDDNPRYRRFNGAMQPPPRGTRMPGFPRQRN